MKRKITGWLLIITAVILFISLSGNESTKESNSTNLNANKSESAPTAVDYIHALCDGLMGLEEPAFASCELSVWDGSIDASLLVSSVKDARMVCKEITRVPVFEQKLKPEGWAVRVFSPIHGDSVLATCYGH